MHISAGHFRVDLMQKPDSIQKALTMSWAEEAGVNLDENPELALNRDKYVFPNDGAKNSEIPYKMYQTFA